MALQDLGWEVLQLPPYSPDYHLFHFLQNALNGFSFHNDAELRKWHEDWSA
ncbi:hypothetical protein WH47_03678 [Habropoda laboriosa]|uniref:Histone-lysine N-methyltransferase SETMAR n=1 Tax=Habropoda laboriosa TaxID=597456 RepID=A0A0L7RI47_9HYME|nr:hypothetical protein WH47_03678 [Habropoda laboriosa]